MIPPSFEDSGSIGETCLRVMIAIALAQPDAAERDAMLGILRADGWLPDDEREAA